MCVSAIPNYMTLYEVAERLGICYSLVARYVRDGRIKSVTVGNTKLVTEDSLDDFKPRPVGRPKMKITA